LLQKEEREHWFSKIYPIDLEAHWWFAFAWWYIRDRCDGADEEIIRFRDANPDGNWYWIVESGVQWTSLAGGYDQELWRWDGRRAKFLEPWCICSF
jgi:hypothetical protein